MEKQNRRLMPTSWLTLMSIMPKKLIYWAVVYAWGEATVGKYKGTLATKLTVGTLLERIDNEWNVTGTPARPPRQRRMKKEKANITIDGKLLADLPTSTPGFDEAAAKFEVQEDEDPYDVAPVIQRAMQDEEIRESKWGDDEQSDIDATNERLRNRIGGIG